MRTRARKKHLGVETDCDGVDWEPLRAVIGMDLADYFMWMYAARLENGTRVHAYKHRDTRRYLFLDGDLQAYGYTYDDDLDGPDFYVEMKLDHAIVAAFSGWYPVSEPAEWERELLWQAVDAAAGRPDRTRSDREEQGT